MLLDPLFGLSNQTPNLTVDIEYLPNIRYPIDAKYLRTEFDFITSCSPRNCQLSALFYISPASPPIYIPYIRYVPQNPCIPYIYL